MKYLSKSDFQLASSCPKKLIYKKLYYPTANDTNEYMQMLAQGGYVVGKMATLYFDGGIEIEGNTNECIEATKLHLQKANVILFEPAIVSGKKLIRIDILVKTGNELHLIEVKAKSHDTEKQDSEKQLKLKKYIDDVAYQYYVLKEAFPEFSIKCSLFMPDKSKRTSIEELASWFTISKNVQSSDFDFEEIPAQQKPKFNKPNVVFKYENSPERLDKINELKENGILSYMDVTDHVKEKEQEIKLKANRFLDIMENGISSSDFQIYKGCKSCEFNTPTELKNGYLECWGTLAYSENHIFDLYKGGSVGSKKDGYYIDELIEQGTINLLDLDVERLKNKKGELASTGQRQIIQIQNTIKNNEWISNKLANKLESFDYPLHFIDFETYQGALPFHKGMRPYELIAFQWSCHTIESKGAAPIHSEWIHTGEKLPNPQEMPNFEFARSLMKQIGLTGSTFMWATHENSVLRKILEQMSIFGVEDNELKNWLTQMTRDKNRDGRLIDMNQLTLEHYFHPQMKGKTSIKKVLPAIWSNFTYLHDVPHFKQYAPENFISGKIDPYDQLSSGISDEDWEGEVVNGGTAAMRAYQRIRFDESLTKIQRDDLRNQLLEYCKLDTMAMVIIAHHWGLK
jgi:hypothetical protein